MKNKIMPSKKFLIISFAIVGALLITSTAYVHPIEAHVTEQSIKSNNDGLGDYLYNLLTDKIYLDNINWVLHSSAPPDDHFDMIQREIVEYIVEDNNDFVGFENKLTNIIISENWKNMPILSDILDELEGEIDEQQILNTHNKAHDYTDNDYKSCYTFQIEKYKDSTSPYGKQKIYNNKFIEIINELTKNSKILNQLLNNIINKKTTTTNKLVSTNEDSYNLLYKYKGEDKKVIEKKPLDKITSFTLFHDIMFKFLDHDDAEKCYKLNEILTDTTQEFNIKSLGNELENLPNILSDITDHPLDDGTGRIGQDLIDELIFELRTNETFIQIGQNIANALNNDNINEEEISGYLNDFTTALLGNLVFLALLAFIGVVYAGCAISHYLAISVISMLIITFIGLLIPYLPFQMLIFGLGIWAGVYLWPWVCLILPLIEGLTLGPISPIIISVILLIIWYCIMKIMKIF